jgi:hypothetical protein
MEPDDMQSPSVDEVLSLGIAELHWPGAEDAEERHEATVASRAVYHLEDIGSLGALSSSTLSHPFLLIVVTINHRQYALEPVHRDSR